MDGAQVHFRQKGGRGESSRPVPSRREVEPGQTPEHNCFWSCNATHTSVPLYVVARVVKLGEVSHMGDTMVEVAFDYGTPWMTSPKRKALVEKTERDGIRILTKKEYEALLPKATAYCEEEEAKLSVKK